MNTTQYASCQAAEAVVYPSQCTTQTASDIALPELAYAITQASSDSSDRYQVAQYRKKRLRVVNLPAPAPFPTPPTTSPSGPPTVRPNPPTAPSTVLLSPCSLHVSPPNLNTRTREKQSRETHTLPTPPTVFPTPELRPLAVPLTSPLPMAFVVLETVP